MNSSSGAGILGPARPRFGRLEGPGDGLPSHSEHLAEAWGREVTISGGDVVGSAYVPKSAVEGERPRIYLQVYYAQEVQAESDRLVLALVPGR